jgi:tetratricopeptide (TPR) repeat protein
MPANSATAAEPQKSVSDLFLLGHVVEASRLLSEAITQGETPDLWNDWAVVQLSLAERAFRRALELDPSHLDAATNLGLLLFATGRLAESAVFLQRALTAVHGPARSHIETLLVVSKTHLPAPPPRSFDREEFLARISHVLDQYFHHGNRSPEIVTPSEWQPRLDR